MFMQKHQFFHFINAFLQKYSTQIKNTETYAYKFMILKYCITGIHNNTLDLNFFFHQFVSMCFTIFIANLGTNIQ